jgi:hypothetical protein
MLMLSRVSAGSALLICLNATIACLRNAWFTYAMVDLTVTPACSEKPATPSAVSMNGSSEPGRVCKVKTLHERAKEFSLVPWCEVMGRELGMQTSFIRGSRISWLPGRK